MFVLLVCTKGGDYFSWHGGGVVGVTKWYLRLKIYTSCTRKAPLVNGEHYYTSYITE